MNKTSTVSALATAMNLFSATAEKRPNILMIAMNDLRHELKLKRG